MTDTIVLGLDGATWTVLDKYIEAGSLPNIASLVEDGYSGTLESTFPPITAPAWLSMATGQNPGKTGVYYYMNRESADSFEFDTFGSEKYQGQSFWDVLAEQGRSVGVFNYPMLYPPYETDGFMVSGLGGPEDDTITYPESLHDELNEVTGGYDVKVPYADPKYRNEPEKLTVDLLDIVEKREAAIKYLLAEKDPDVFFGVVSATDWAQHYFWQYYDPDHVWHEPGHEAKLRRVWERVDQTVRLVSDFAERNDARLFVVSDHGFGPVNRTFYLNEWLENEGYRVSAGGQPFSSAWLRMFPYIKSITQRLVSKVPLLNDVAVSVGRSVKPTPNEDLDWDRSTAFAPEHNITCGMIHLLSDDETMNEEIKRSLGEIEVDGKSLSVEVYEREELYQGRNVDLAPELLIEVDGFECAVEPRFSKNGRRFKKGPPLAARSGGHNREGILIISGEGVTPAANREASLLDIAPTLLFLEDAPIPNVVDGEPLLDALENSITERSVKWKPLANILPQSETVRAMDTEETKERLEDLGYL